MKTIIHSNGSKWAGESPDSIAKLIEVLKEYTIEERFFKSFWHGSGKDLKQLQLCPISVTDGMTWFFGNFFEVSHVFRIETNDPEVIDKLTEAIHKNKGWLKYYEKNLIKHNHEKQL